MRVRISRSAAAELAAIGDWIAEDNPARATTFVRELSARCMSLANRPNRFPVAQRVGGQEFRKVSHKSYLIFYVVLEDRVEIVHIVHGARDWTALIGEED